MTPSESDEAILSKEETAVFKLTVEGRTVEEIARMLRAPVRAVGRRMAKICRQLQLKSGADFFRHALGAHLFTLSADQRRFTWKPAASVEDGGRPLLHSGAEDHRRAQPSLRPVVAPFEWISVQDLAALLETSFLSVMMDLATWQVHEGPHCLLPREVAVAIAARHGIRLERPPRVFRLRRRGPLARRIIAGGQPGAERAALEWAIAQNISHGGYCAPGRRAKGGPIPGRFCLREMTGAPDAAGVVRRNVMKSDGTILFTLGPELTGSARWAAESARKWGKPYIHVRGVVPLEINAELIQSFVVRRALAVVHVTGTSRFEEAGMGNYVKRVLTAALSSTAMGGVYERVWYEENLISDPDSVHREPLSRMETAVLQHLVEGKGQTPEALAKALGVGLRTACRHRNSVLQKLRGNPLGFAVMRDAIAPEKEGQTFWQPPYLPSECSDLLQLNPPDNYRDLMPLSCVGPPQFGPRMHPVDLERVRRLLAAE